ncbi:TIR domain-containing protein [Streptomyces sp. JNUCC 64]
MSMVFVNYRTGDEEATATLVERELSRVFGSASVFRAGKSISPGSRFPQELLTAARSCRVLLAVIGPRWLDARTADGRPALEDPGDWPRREILEAHRAGAVVLPLLVGRTARLRHEDLPDGLDLLADRQYLRLDHRNAEADLSRLTENIARLVPDAPALTPAAPPGLRPVGEAPAGKRRRDRAAAPTRARAVLRQEDGRSLIAAALVTAIALGWPGWAWYALPAVVAGALLIAFAPGGTRGRPRSEPPFMESVVTDVQVSSALSGYPFLFSAVVRWRADSTAHGDPSAVAVAAVLDRVERCTRAEHPTRGAYLGHRLAGLLGTPVHDDSGTVLAYATRVRLTLRQRDRNHPAEPEALRKSRGVRVNGHLSGLLDELGVVRGSDEWAGYVHRIARMVEASGNGEAAEAMRRDVDDASRDDAPTGDPEPYRDHGVHDAHGTHGTHGADGTDHGGTFPAQDVHAHPDGTAPAQDAPAHPNGTPPAQEPPTPDGTAPPAPEAPWGPGPVRTSWGQDPGTPWAQDPGGNPWHGPRTGPSS